MPSNNFSKNSLITFSTEIFVFVFGFITLVILARVLGPEGKGIYSLILLIPGLMIALGNLGIGSANVYFAGSKKYKTQDIVSNSLVFALLLGFILIIIFWGLTQFDFFQRFINSNKIPSLYLWMVVFTIPISFLLSFFRGIILGKERIINYNKTRLLEGIIQLTAVIILLLILKQGIFGAVSSYILAIVGATLFAFISVKKIIKFRFFLNKKLLKDSTIYGGKVHSADVLSFLNYRLDMFLIAFFLTPVAVGFYSIAVGISERLRMIPGALATVLFPKISSLKDSEANDFTPKIIRHTFFITVISSLLLILLARPLIELLFGTDFLPAIMPLIILVPGIIAMGVGETLAADLAGRGKPRFAVYSSLTCLIINIPLNIILIPLWGISGAAFASAVAYCADTLVILIAFLVISKRPLREVLLIKKDDFRDYFQVFLNLKNWIWRIEN